MKKYTREEFETLINDQNWTRKSETEQYATVQRGKEVFNETTKEPELEEYDHSFGAGKLINTHNTDNIKIIFNESYTYDNFESDTFCHSTDALDTVWEFEGFEVVDEDGDIIQILDLVYDLSSEFSQIDYSEIIDMIEKSETIEIDDKSHHACSICSILDVENECKHNQNDYVEIFVKIDNQPNLHFVGMQIGFASSKTTYRNDRWTELKLFSTKSGKFVCQEIYYTLWQGDRDKYKGAVCETIEEVFEFFGYGWLAKELYNDATIDATLKID